MDQQEDQQQGPVSGPAPSWPSAQSCPLTPLGQLTCFYVFIHAMLVAKGTCRYLGFPEGSIHFGPTGPTWAFGVFLWFEAEINFDWLTPSAALMCDSQKWKIILKFLDFHDVFGRIFGRTVRPKKCGQKHHENISPFDNWKDLGVLTSRLFWCRLTEDFLMHAWA
jgi:hypothetical protein